MSEQQSSLLTANGLEREDFTPQNSDLDKAQPKGHSRRRSSHQGAVRHHTSTMPNSNNSISVHLSTDSDPAAGETSLLVVKGRPDPKAHLTLNDDGTEASPGDANSDWMQFMANISTQHTEISKHGLQLPTIVEETQSEVESRHWVNDEQEWSRCYLFKSTNSITDL